MAGIPARVPLGALAWFQPSTSRIVVRMVPRPGFGPREEQALEREFRARLGNEIEIVYERTDAIPRLPNGKFRAVVSEVEAGKLR